MQPTLSGFDSRDFLFLAPAVVLAVWGVVVLVADLAFGRRKSSDERRRSIGMLAMAGVALAMISSLGLIQLQTVCQSEDVPSWINPSLASFIADHGGVMFLGTISSSIQTEIFNVLFIALLGLVVWLSMSWSFTEDWGEYYALIIWATVGMMILAAAEELITMFISLEMMTICLYLATAFEKQRRRSTEAGFKYFIYGSVASACFLFGLSLIYGLTGTTQMESIRTAIASSTTEVAHGLKHNLIGAAAILLLLAGFGFKVAAVPFHQWAPDVYEGAPAPVSAWIATGSKIAAFIAFMKIFVHALQPWSNPSAYMLGPGWLGLISVVAAVTMIYGSFAALAQRNLKRMLAYSSIAHAGYLLVGVAAVSVSKNGPASAGAVLFYLVTYAFATVGAFAVAAWLVKDLKSDDIDDLNGLGYQSPLLAACIVFLMLSLIGIPPLAGFFGKLYVFMEALNQRADGTRLALLSLVIIGLFTTVVSAFYYLRVLKAMYLKRPSPDRLLAAPESTISTPIFMGTFVIVLFGLAPWVLMSVMQAAAVPMLTASVGGLVFAPVGSEYQPLSQDRRFFDSTRTREQIDTSKRMSPEESKRYAAQMWKGTQAGMMGAPQPGTESEAAATKKADDGPAAKKDEESPGKPAAPSAEEKKSEQAPASAGSSERPS